MRPDWNNIPLTADFADLDGYAHEFKAEHSFKQGIDTLPDGHYDCTIVSAQMDKVKGDTIARITLKVPNGAQVEWTCWLNKQNGVNAFAADMAALGMDSHLWGPAHNRPLSKEIPAAVTKLAGIKFRAHKSSRDVPAQPGKVATTYHDFRVIGRVGGQPMPNVNQPARQVQAPASPAPAPQMQPAGGAPDNNDEDLPF